MLRSFVPVLKKLKFRGTGRALNKLGFASKSLQNYPFHIFGREISIDLRDKASVGFFLYETIPHEHLNIQFLELLFSLNKNLVFYDIGANVGFYTLYFSQPQFQLKKIFSFEPNPKLSRNLVAATKESNNIVVLPIGLGEKDDQMSLRMDEGLSDTATFRKKSIKEGGVFENIPIRSIDSLLNAGEITGPSLIKMDVEGFEFYVLKGFSRINEFKPLILMEWIDEFMSSINIKFEDLKNLLGKDWKFYDLKLENGGFIYQEIQAAPATRDILLLHSSCSLKLPS